MKEFRNKLIVHGLMKINDKYLVIKRSIIKRGKPNVYPEYWDIPGGSVEDFETPIEALIREAKEELDIDISIDNIIDTFVVNRRNKSLLPYYDIYFEIGKYNGTIKINELNKCSELVWTDLDKLPNDMIDFEKVAIYNNLNGIKFSVIDVDNK